MDSEIEIYLNAADVAVFPFKQITNSGSAILAKSFYKPTICIDRGNIKDYVNPVTDILVRSEAELEKAITEASSKVFPKGKEEYLKGIPGPAEVAQMHRKLYEELC